MSPREKKPDAQLVLCVFPNQSDFIVVDTRQPGGEIVELSIRDLLNDETVKDLEGKFSRMLEESTYAFRDMMGLPLRIENLLQHASITSLLRIIDGGKKSFREGTGVFVMMFTGELLKADMNRLRDVLKEYFEEKLSPQLVDNLAVSLEQKITKEKEIDASTSREIFRRIMSEDENMRYRTVWKNTQN